MSTVDSSDRVGELPGVVVFDEVPAGTGADRGAHMPAVPVHGEHEHPGTGGAQRGDVGGRLGTVLEHQVQQHDIGLGGVRDVLGDAGGGVYQTDVGTVREQCAQPGRYQLVVVDDGDPDR